MRVSAWSDSGAGSLPGCRLPYSRHVPTWWREEWELWIPLYNGTNPIHESPTLVNLLLPKSPTC